MSNNLAKSKQDYQKEVKRKRVEQKTIFKNFIYAYIIGGLFCIGGQLITDLLLNYGFSETEATSYMALILILFGGVLTGIGVYDEIAQVAGAGIIVLIIGFANAVVAPAMEFRQEGYVTGLGAKMYSVAGPVLTYGILSAFLAGLIRLLII